MDAITKLVNGYKEAVREEVKNAFFEAAAIAGFDAEIAEKWWEISGSKKIADLYE